MEIITTTAIGLSFAHSPDDGGWYFELCDQQGRELPGDGEFYESRLACATVADAFVAAHYPELYPRWVALLGEGEDRPQRFDTVWRGK